jgi:hypothetical protein
VNSAAEGPHVNNARTHTITKEKENGIQDHFCEMASKILAWYFHLEGRKMIILP